MGYALHYNVDANGAAALPATASAPNPELWELIHKTGKGFVLEEGSEEIVHDID